MSKILKEYVRETLNEKYFLRRYGSSPSVKDFAPGGIFKKIGSYIFGSGKSDVASQWISDAERLYDVEIDSSLRDEIENYVSRKYPYALERAENDEERAKAIISKALDVRYTRKLRDSEAK